MKRILAVVAMLLLVGCNLDLDGILITPTSVGVIATSTPTATPYVVTATPEPTQTPTNTPTITPTPEGFIPTPTPLVSFEDGCEWQQGVVQCQAETCVVRTQPLPGDIYKAYSVPRGTELEMVAVCQLGNESWFSVGVSASNVLLWARNLETVWIQVK